MNTPELGLTNMDEGVVELVEGGEKVTPKGFSSFLIILRVSRVVKCRKPCFLMYSSIA